MEEGMERVDVLESDRSQSWFNCRYAVGSVNEQGIPPCFMKEGDVYQIYGCMNEEVKKIGIYPKEKVIVIVGCGFRKEYRKMAALAYLGKDFVRSEEERKGLVLEMKRRLIGPCRNCEQHKDK